MPPDAIPQATSPARRAIIAAPQFTPRYRKHNTQLYFSAKPYSDTSVGNFTIGSKGQHRRVTSTQPLSAARVAAFCSTRGQVARIERKRNPGPPYQSGTAAPGFRLALNPGYTPAKLSLGATSGGTDGLKKRRLAPS